MLMTRETPAPLGTTSEALQRIPSNWGVGMTIAAFTAVAWYNIAELNVQVFLTFKRHRGLYFWSLLISSYGCVLHSLGFLLKLFGLTPNIFIPVTILTIGWYCMVTGQAVVLYSRLHLVVREQRVLRGILAMIIIDAICFHIPTTVLTYGDNLPNIKADNRFIGPFNVVEKLQMTAFCIQEFIISGVYVWATISLLRPVYHGRTRRVMTQLIWINFIIIGMDVCLLAVEYSNLYDIEATLKAMVYSIKLKLEFAVLNQLMTLANSSVSHHQNLAVEDSGEKGTRPPAGRSRSTEYISNKYQKPDRRSRSQKQRPSQMVHKSYSSRTASQNNQNHFQWVPTLDRKHIVETRHVENADSELNVFTNPAACFKRGRTPPDGYPPHDGLGGIPDSPVLSPALTGTTLDDAPARESRRAPPPPSLNLHNAILPNGLLRSTRPSVSDWAHGPDSDASPTSDEAHLDPHDHYGSESRGPGSVTAGRNMADQSIADRNRGDCNMNMDFMTSALRR